MFDYFYCDTSPQNHFDITSEHRETIWHSTQSTNHADNTFISEQNELKALQKYNLSTVEFNILGNTHSFSCFCGCAECDNQYHSHACRVKVKKTDSWQLAWCNKEAGNRVKQLSESSKIHLTAPIIWFSLIQRTLFYPQLGN